MNKTKLLSALFHQIFQNIINILNNITTKDMLSSKGCFIKMPFELMNSDNLIITGSTPIHIEYGARFFLREKLFIGGGTIIGPKCTIHTSSHNYNGSELPYDKEYKSSEIHIGENVWIGDQVTLLPGSNIGEGAVIGANSVIASAIPEGAIVVGNPAKIIKYRDMEKYWRLKSDGLIYLVNKKRF